MNIKVGDIVTNKPNVHQIQIGYTKVYHIGEFQGCGSEKSIWGIWVGTIEEAVKIVYESGKENIRSSGGRLTYADDEEDIVVVKDKEFVPVSRKEARRLLYNNK